MQVMCFMNVFPAPASIVFGSWAVIYHGTRQRNIASRPTGHSHDPTAHAALPGQKACRKAARRRARGCTGGGVGGDLSGLRSRQRHPAGPVKRGWASRAQGLKRSRRLRMEKVFLVLSMV